MQILILSLIMWWCLRNYKALHKLLYKIYLIAALHMTMSISEKNSLLTEWYILAITIITESNGMQLCIAFFFKISYSLNVFFFYTKMMDKTSLREGNLCTSFHTLHIYLTGLCLLHWHKGKLSDAFSNNRKRFST